MVNLPYDPNSITITPEELESIHQALQLDGPELLDKVTLHLHRRFESFCTCIVEVDRHNYRAQTLSHACHHQLQRDTSFPLEGTPCESISQHYTEALFIKDDIAQRFPNDSRLTEHNINAYLGIPLTTRSGEVLGILFSTFTDAINDSSELFYFHQVFANLVVHSLRAKWLAARSESLVNQLSYEVSHDNLTGLMNRSYLSDKLERLTDVNDDNFTLAYLDIDSFKTVNDLYGHYIGDQVIKFVAETITSQVSDEHLAFRIAGDEFAFISYSNDPLLVCHRILALLEDGYSDPCHSIKVSAHIGIARRSDSVTSADQLILNASLALKNCKQSRNVKVQCYDTHLSDQYYRRARIIDALRCELDSPLSFDSDIYVVAQPIVRRHSKHWNYFEMLARWENKELGIISPIEFIEAAEQSGLIVDLGERIIELSCQAKQKLEQGLGYKVRTGINCSAYELNDPERYLSHLRSMLTKYDFLPCEFTIELTETVLLSETEDVKYLLDRLRALGFTIALDDFGTGYSSLNYIHSYPIDCIKIDASFIKNMLSSTTSERVVWLIIQLATQLELDLIAEGVETSQALEKLYSMGCEQIQGYYFSKPEEPEVIIERHIQQYTSLSDALNNETAN
ncbi:putative bifunctional diguanylate cyclase/phosphodiesterase [Vibrio sp.]|uniref:putative bifunctional diguanylate cyclase/phosphodiesterase n=1 Tax=Vibrio sp. TaxID=678 RepID=UPI003D13BC93